MLKGQLYVESKLYVQIQTMLLETFSPKNTSSLRQHCEHQTII